MVSFFVGVNKREEKTVTHHATKGFTELLVSATAAVNQNLNYIFGCGQWTGV